ncbi:S8 family serine peptidase [Flaviaesturariibacter amylovorans]|uniref:Fibronectin type-III domain-containing protein n=1 Tax=Flaviaesturariibacter amylovorans TaxID=1084520 RepID=A0ABP8GDI3_9BACT
MFFMDRIRNTLLLVLLCFAGSLAAQEPASTIRLRTGALSVSTPDRHLVDSLSRTLPRIGGRVQWVLQFGSVPAEGVRKALAAAGIELQQYLGEGTYTAAVAGTPAVSALAAAGVRGLSALAPEQKMDALLKRAQLPAWAVATPGTIDVLIRVPKSFSIATILTALQERRLPVTDLALQRYGILGLRLAPSRLRELAALPFVEYLQPRPPAPQPLNYNNRSGSRAGMLGAPLAAGGRALDGSGVVLGIGDDADVQTIGDFNGRLINHATHFNSNHGIHVTGTAAGAGHVNELYKGMAPGATIVSAMTSGILTNAATYHADYGMVLTNNSYGNIIECEYMGLYDLYSAAMDQQAIELPELLHIFAAGNSGTLDCAPYGQGFHTVLGGYQSAKNVVTVGATSDSGLIASFSSRGPVRDGRLKPEIVAQGRAVVSNNLNNTYVSSQGTSMAAPTVTGGLALLYQRYKQLNGGSNPKGALMKALLCNGATDRGTAGPDFQYGHGWMNLLRSVEMLEGGRYASGSSTQGGTISHTVAVPANTAQLKVLLYWHDPAASPLAAKTLVNDLDLEVVDLSNNTVLPFRLDTANAALGAPAFTAADHQNNMEQVLIDAPPAGNYTIRVKGTTIAQNGSQPYFLVWDPVPVSLQLMNPAGGEGWVPGDVMVLHWDAWGEATSTYALDYSIDGGNNWLPIASALEAGRRQYTWTVPSVATGQARVRVRQEATTLISTSADFTILGAPTATLAATADQCEGYINLSWTTVANATDYEVMLLRSGRQVSMATTTSTSYVLKGLATDTTYWVSVRARINGQPGRRSAALSRTPSSGSCSNAMTDGDLKMNALSSPVTRRHGTSGALTSTTRISASVRNLDNVAITGFELRYRVNGGAWVVENVASTVGANSTLSYNFTTRQNMAAAGDYYFTLVVTAPGDTNPANDTLNVLVRHLDNSAVTLPFFDNLEGLTDTAYGNTLDGLRGSSRYDFSRSSSNARLRTSVNSAFSYSGTQAFTLDQYRYNAGGTTNYIIGTFNLAAYNAASDDVRLDFAFLDHGQSANAANRVWVRGSDAGAWIEAYSLDANSPGAGTYTKSSSIEVARLLAANGQAFTSTFQVRWGQYGIYPATEPAMANGYSFDDIHLYKAENDVQLLAITSPVAHAAALGSAAQVTVSVRNGSFATLSNIPVRYRINGGAWTSGVIPSLAPGSTTSYGFLTGANLSAFGTYNVEAIVDQPGDSYRANDTARLVVVNSPLITSFPYIQDFEGGSSYWYTGGTNPSWEWGAPASTRISRAASGSNAWKTRLVGNYNDNEHSYLYSPAFDVSGLSSPALSFSVALDIEDCGSSALCDGAWVEYSADGSSWTKLGTSGNGTNWYNRSTFDLWSVERYTAWHAASIPLPSGATALRLRFVFASDVTTSREGIAIDDIHIYNNATPLFDSGTLSNPVTQGVSGTGWTTFTSGGKLIAALNPHGQDLGATKVQVYIDTTHSRWINSQYYLARHLTVKPANESPGDSVSVRLYFSEREAQLLIDATGCAGCSQPATAYELGISKFTNAPFEDSSIANNTAGQWYFIAPAKRTMVPFDKGYYLEFKVKNFSEFWFNTGGVNAENALPVRFVSFNAQRRDNLGLLDWKVATEESVLAYEVQAAKGEAALQRGRFELLGSVAGGGNTAAGRNYRFTDSTAGKTGTWYYRLRVRNADGSFQYSEVRPVQFSGSGSWSVAPNPSSGIFGISFRAAAGSPVRFRVYDGQGRLLQRFERSASGFPEKAIIDLGKLPPGAYLCQVDTEDGPHSFRLYKQ